MVVDKPCDSEKKRFSRPYYYSTNSKGKHANPTKKVMKGTNVELTIKNLSLRVDGRILREVGRGHNFRDKRRCKKN